MRHLQSILAAGVVGAAFLIPGVARADTVVVAPEAETTTTVTTTSTNTPVIVSGALTFGVAYGAAAIGAMLSTTETDHRLYVPLLGPWLALADRPTCPVSQVTCDWQTSSKILIGVDGVFQALGVVTAIYGILTPRHNVIGGGVEVTPVAMGHGATGLALTGSF